MVPSVIISDDSIRSGSDYSHQQKSRMENPWSGMRFIVHPINRDEFHPYRYPGPDHQSCHKETETAEMKKGAGSAFFVIFGTPD